MTFEKFKKKTLRNPIRLGKKDSFKKKRQENFNDLCKELGFSEPWDMNEKHENNHELLKRLLARLNCFRMAKKTGAKPRSFQDCWPIYWDIYQDTRDDDDDGKEIKPAYSFKEAINRAAKKYKIRYDQAESAYREVEAFCEVHADKVFSWLVEDHHEPLPRWMTQPSNPEWTKRKPRSLSKPKKN